MDKNTICNILEDIAKTADHQIPFYAYGDNEAACDMDLRLREIYEKAIQYMQDILEEEE